MERSNQTGDSVTPAGTTTYFLADQIHSTRMTLAYGGWPMTQDTYYPFGVEPTPSASPDQYKFSGKERDPASGLDNFGARYYSAVMGRFMTPDFSDMPEAMPFADLSNPQSFNRFVYVEGNPLTGIDADGHLTLGPNGGFCGTSGTGVRPSMWTSGSDFVLNLVPCSAPMGSGFWYSADNGESQQWADQLQWAREYQHTMPTSNGCTHCTDFVSISDWPTGAGGFHHTGIAVDSDDTWGFSTLDPSIPWLDRLFSAPPGHMENDVKHHIKNGEIARHSYIHIPISAAQAAEIQAAIKARRTDPGRYNLIFRNCAGAVESILHSGGVSGIPHREVFVPILLHGILLFEGDSR